MAVIDSAFLILPAASTRIGPLAHVVDGYHAEEHQLKTRKTTYPVESGAALTDHAVRDPNKLKLQGWASDLLPAGASGQGASRSDRAALAWGEIGRLMADRELVTAATMLGTYVNMLITSASAPVDRTTGRALRFSLELEEVLFAPLVRVSLGAPSTPTPDGPAAERLRVVDLGLMRALAPSPAERNHIFGQLSAAEQLRVVDRGLMQALAPSPAERNHIFGQLEG